MNVSLKERIFSIRDQRDFSLAAIEIFDWQYQNNPVYRSFVTHLGRKDPDSIMGIPFLPVEFFRNHIVITGSGQVEKIFESSGTTGMTTSKHYVSDLGIYNESFMRAFRIFYGNPADYLITALLPSYLEREGSSLVYMADKLMQESGNHLNGFYRDNPAELVKLLTDKSTKGRKKLLIGVSFALLDMAEQFQSDLSDVIIMETGGMKGRRKEITRQELHSVIREKLNSYPVHSEYGMTELMSQAYSAGNGIFQCPPWMKIMIRDPYDPLTIHDEPGKTGGINIIDLANYNSCAFIATGDLGRLHEDGRFEVLGRFDNSDIRGCNLLVE